MKCNFQLSPYVHWLMMILHVKHRRLDGGNRWRVEVQRWRKRMQINILRLSKYRPHIIRKGGRERDGKKITATHLQVDLHCKLQLLSFTGDHLAAQRPIC